MNQDTVTEIAAIDDCLVSFNLKQRCVTAKGQCLPDGASDEAFAMMMLTTFAALNDYTLGLIDLYNLPDDMSDWIDLRDELTDEDFEALDGMFEVHRYIGHDDLAWQREQSRPTPLSELPKTLR